jgi:hypothetical protein
MVGKAHSWLLAPVAAALVLAVAIIGTGGIGGGGRQAPVRPALRVVAGVVAPATASPSPDSDPECC